MFADIGSMLAESSAIQHFRKDTVVTINHEDPTIEDGTFAVAKIKADGWTIDELAGWIHQCVSNGSTNPFIFSCQEFPSSIVKEMYSADREFGNQMILPALDGAVSMWSNNPPNYSALYELANITANIMSESAIRSLLSIVESWQVDCAEKEGDQIDIKIARDTIVDVACCFAESNGMSERLLLFLEGVDFREHALLIYNCVALSRPDLEPQAWSLFKLHLESALAMEVEDRPFEIPNELEVRLG